MKSTPLAVAGLFLDKENPRLPEVATPTSQKALARHIANEYNTLDVARSIAEHGYFDSEPLIAIKSGPRFVVVEGNRRLTALKLLSNDVLRGSLNLDQQDEWNQLADQTTVEEEVQVVVAKNRDDVAPIIGYRHIAGIEPWDPWAKARFIARQVEKEGKSFAETSRIVGEDEPKVRAHYRNYRIIRSAEALGVQTREAKNQFGFFTRAMNSVGLREHIGAPLPADVKRKQNVIKSSRKSKVKELFGWMFGTGTQLPVVGESRQLSKLGEIVASPEGLKALRRTRNLEEGLIASGGVRDRLVKRLLEAQIALERAEDDILAHRDDQSVRDFLVRCREALERLEALIANG